jgi:hypothetical protein
VTADGETVLDPVVREIEVVEDAAPSIDLLEPGDALEVTPEEVVDLHFVARDDFGLRDVRVMWHFSGDPSSAAQVTARTVPGETHHEEHVPMDLLPLELQPRDEIVVYVEATDGDTVSGAKTGRSRSVILRVASADDAHDDVLALKEQLFEQLLAQLGDALSAGINVLDREAPEDIVRVIPAGGTNADRADRVRLLRATHDGWHSLDATFDALLAAMREDPLSIDADLELLSGIASRLTTVVEVESERLRAIGASTGDGPASAPYEAVAHAAADTVATTERAILVVQDLVATHRADDVTRAMAELDQSRDRLRELLEAYRDTQDPALRAQIERDLQRLEQRMRELIDRIAAQAEQLPVEHLNADALEPSELGESVREMGSSLDQLRALLDAGDIDAALEALEALEREMDGIGQELSPLAGAQPETLSEYDQRMGEMMDALGDLEALERSIEEDTQRVLDEMLAERAEAMRERTESALSRMEEELRTMRDALEPGEGDLLGEGTARRLADARDALRSLEERLESGDVAGSVDSADRAMSQLFDAGWELRREALLNARDSDRAGEIDNLRQRAEEAAGAVRQVQRELSELLDQAAPRPNAEQSAQLRELAERQATGLGQLQALQDRAGEMGERFPSMEGELGPALEAIGEHMDSAAQRLDERASREALRSENAALEAIEGARQTMQQLTQRQRQRERAQSGRRPEERVEVPEDGESSRAEFRRRVIEAMREEGLDAYEDEIRQYYDRLLE